MEDIDLALLRKKRQATLKLYGSEANELLQKMFIQMPDLEEQVIQARKKLKEQNKRNKKKHLAKRKLMKEHKQNEKLNKRTE